MQEEISFGVWLRKQRRALDLTRQAFADQIGCAEVTLRRIEAGTLKPSKELARILLEKLGIPGTEWPQWISFARGSSGFPAKFGLSSNQPITITNLPVSITTFIGREKEQSDVIELLMKNRLVTLVGTGGVGKTRLAIKVGEQVLRNYADGIWLVELASLSNPSLIAQTFAAPLRITAQSTIPITDLLINLLRAKSVLLIIDNCEHLLDACAHLIDTLLKNCLHLKILATSRESLGITGEAIYLVPSLQIPDLHQLIDSFRDFESIRLFEERAQLIDFDFSLTLENAAPVVQICQCLDGIPLAIELAAAKVNMLSIEQIAKQLDESFNVLTEGSRTALPRHQTLRASMNWSWGLLTEAEQTLMRQLSVFAGGWTLEAAQAICGDDAFELSHFLLKKSLIVLDREAAPEQRYRFHETIRQYAHEKLLEAGGDETIRDKHLAYFVKLAEEAAPELYHSNQVSWLNKIDYDLDNLRRALEWAFATDAKSGLRLMVALRFFWEAHGDFQEVEAWLAKLLAQYRQEDSVRVQGLVIYAKVLADRGIYTEAQKVANQSLEISRAISDKQAEAFSLWCLGMIIAFFQGDLGKGIPMIEQSLALYESLGDKLGRATALDWLSIDHHERERSKAYIVESLKLYHELGHLAGIAMCLVDLVSVLFEAGDFSTLKPLLAEAYTIYRQLGNRTGEAWIMTLYGMLASWQGDHQQAYTYFEQAIRLYEKVGVLWSQWSRVQMAYAFLRQGDIVRARKTFAISLQQFQKRDDVGGLIYSIEGLASMNVNQGQPERAARLFAWADSMREKIGTPRPLIEQASIEHDLVVIHTKLGTAEFAELAAEGRAMTVEQAVAHALESAEEI